MIQQILSRNDSEFLRELTSRNRLKIYTFSDRTIEIATLKANRTDGVNAQDGADDLDRAAIQLRHDGPVTNLGQTLRHAVDSLDGPLAAVVVISDGGFNQGEQSDVLGQFARARNFPIYAIGVGDPLPPANVRVASMKAPPSAFVKDPFEIEAQIEVAGKANQSVTVELPPLGMLAGAGQANIRVQADGQSPQDVYVLWGIMPESYLVPAAISLLVGLAIVALSFVLRPSIVINLPPTP